MIKKYLKIVALTAVILSTPLLASEKADAYKYDTYSLVGIEGGYGRIDAERTGGGQDYKNLGADAGQVGLKIGAQSTNYRIFLSARYYAQSDFDYLTTYGVEAQYLFNMASWVNFYIGANGGLANMRFYVEPEKDSRTMRSPYFGGDLGFNFHAGDSIDFEIGTRVMRMDAENTREGVTYTFSSIISGYASVIFKFKMD